MPAPAYMSRIGEEVAKAAPAAYGSQSKPRGRKPQKNKNVEKSDDHENGDDADDMACPLDHSERPKKIRKGKGKKNKRSSKKSTKKSTKTTKTTKKGKRKSAKKAKTVNPPDMEDYEHDVFEPSEVGVHDLDYDNGSVGSGGVASGGPSSGSRDVPGDVSGSNSLGAVPKAKVGSKSKGKKKKSKPSDEVEPVGPDPLAPPSIPPNMAYPPVWVKAANVYSNSYRRAKAQGKSPEETREIAKDCAARFRQWGAVDVDLIGSFGLEKQTTKRRRNNLGPDEDGHPPRHEGDGMDNAHGMEFEGEGGINREDAADDAA